MVRRHRRVVCPRVVASGLAVELPTDDDVMSSALLVRDCWCVTSLGVASPVRRVSPRVLADVYYCRWRCARRMWRYVSGGITDLAALDFGSEMTETQPLFSLTPE